MFATSDVNKCVQVVVDRFTNISLPVTQLTLQIVRIANYLFKQGRVVSGALLA